MRRLTRRVACAAVLLAAGVLAACSGDNDATVETAGRLVTQRVEAGAVSVTITPTQIDGNGAVFEVALDTHSVELEVDVAANASLVVDGVDWPGASWQGDRPGGHHRAGTLRFDSGGEPDGTVELTIGGLVEPVRAAWDPNLM